MKSRRRGSAIFPAERANSRSSETAWLPIAQNRAPPFARNRQRPSELTTIIHTLVIVGVIGQEEAHSPVRRPATVAM